MKYLKTVRRYKLQDLSELLNALARFPYFGGFISLLSALHDLYDMVSSLFNKKIVEKKVVVSSAFSRCCAHTLIGLGGLVPLVTIAAFMLFHPCIIPLVALYVASVELYKFCKIVNTTRDIVKEKGFAFKNNPTLETLTELKEARELFYQAKQERIINIGLLIGAALGVVGLIFPPLLMAGVAFSLTSAVLGLIDKKYRISESISYFIYGNPDIEEEQLLDHTPSIVPIQPLNNDKALYTSEPVDINNRKTEVHYPKKTISNHPDRFFNSKPAMLVAGPGLVALNHYHP